MTYYFDQIDAQKLYRDLYVSNLALLPENIDPPNLRVASTTVIDISNKVKELPESPLTAELQRLALHGCYLVHSIAQKFVDRPRGDYPTNLTSWITKLIMTLEQVKSLFNQKNLTVGTSNAIQRLNLDLVFAWGQFDDFLNNRDGGNTIHDNVKRNIYRGGKYSIENVENAHMFREAQDSEFFGGIYTISKG